MKKSVSRGIIFAFSIVALVALPIIGLLLLFVGAFAEALVVAMTAGYASADGALIEIFVPFAIIIFATWPFLLAATIVGFIKKENKALAIVAGSLYGACAIAMFVGVIMGIVVGAGLDGAGLTIFTSVVFGLSFVLCACGALFRGFLRLLKKPEQVENA
ncbi:MAG: hypothetical protein K6E11_00450 [Bacilli bacterium]|nr:hypothetical protein [Bacilli bacterium]